MSNDLIPQHKRLAMGLPVNNPPAGSGKKMVDMGTKTAANAKSAKAPAFSRSKIGK
jgi:hypothetical protein